MPPSAGPRCRWRREERKRERRARLVFFFLRRGVSLTYHGGVRTLRVSRMVPLVFLWSMSSCGSGPALVCMGPPAPLSSVPVTGAGTRERERESRGGSGKHESGEGCGGGEQESPFFVVSSLRPSRACFSNASTRERERERGLHGARGGRQTEREREREMWRQTCACMRLRGSGSVRAASAPSHTRTHSPSPLPQTKNSPTHNSHHGRHGACARRVPQGSSLAPPGGVERAGWGRARAGRAESERRARASESEQKKRPGAALTPPAHLSPFHRPTAWA